jgi:hypothetical protein
VESLFFGGEKALSLDKAFMEETRRLDRIVEIETQAAQQRRQSRNDSSSNEEHGATSSSSGDHALHHSDKTDSTSVKRLSRSNMIYDDDHDANASSSSTSSSNDFHDSSAVDGSSTTSINMLEQDPTLKAWIRSSNVNFEEEELQLQQSKKRDNSYFSSTAEMRRDSRNELQHYLHTAAPLVPFSSTSSTSSTAGTSASRNNSLAQMRRPSATSTIVNSLANIFSSGSSSRSNSHNYSAVLSDDEEDEHPNTTVERARKALLDAEDGRNCMCIAIYRPIYYLVCCIVPCYAYYTNYMHFYQSILAEDVEAQAHSAAVEPAGNNNNNNIATNTHTGGISTVLPIHVLTNEQLNELTLLSIEKAKLATKQGWTQTKVAGM